MDIDNGIFLQARMKRQRESLSLQSTELSEIRMPQAPPSTPPQMVSPLSCGMMMQSQQDFLQPQMGTQWTEKCGEPQVQPGLPLQLCIQQGGPSKEYLEKNALIDKEFSARLKYKAESAEIERAKVERQMKNRENQRIERQARVAEVELLPEGVPYVSHKRVELPDLKCRLTQCRLESCILRPDDTNSAHLDGVLLVICIYQDGDSKKIFLKLRNLTGKEFRRRMMRNGVKFLAADRKANDLAESLLQVLIENAKEVRVPTKLGWNVQGSQITYVKDGQLLWKDVISNAEDS